jgi:hypothetical protein
MSNIETEEEYSDYDEGYETGGEEYSDYYESDRIEPVVNESLLRKFDKEQKKILQDLLSSEPEDPTTHLDNVKEKIERYETLTHKTINAKWWMANNVPIFYHALLNGHSSAVRYLLYEKGASIILDNKNLLYELINDVVNTLKNYNEGYKYRNEYHRVDMSLTLRLLLYRPDGTLRVDMKELLREYSDLFNNALYGPNCNTFMELVTAGLANGIEDRANIVGLDQNALGKLYHEPEITNQNVFEVQKYKQCRNEYERLYKRAGIAPSVYYGCDSDSCMPRSRGWLWGGRTRRRKNNKRRVARRGRRSRRTRRRY